MEPVKLLDDEGRTRLMWMPSMDLEGSIRHTEFQYVVQRFDILEARRLPGGP